MNVTMLLQKGVNMRSIKLYSEKPSFWQLVFSQSKANGADYYGEELPGYTWNWPGTLSLPFVAPFLPVRRAREIRDQHAPLQRRGMSCTAYRGRFSASVILGNISSIPALPLVTFLMVFLFQNTHPKTSPSDALNPNEPGCLFANPETCLLIRTFT